MRLTEEQYEALLVKRRQLTAIAKKMLTEVVVGKPSTSVKRPKYGNRKVTDDEGNVHDSTKEYRRWCELQLREHAGEITNLRRHVRYDFCVNGVFVGFYTADAVYDEKGRTVVEDTKSAATRRIRDYPMRKKLMKACHGIELQEV